jgi:hypothetical protein
MSKELRAGLGWGGPVIVLSHVLQMVILDQDQGEHKKTRCLFLIGQRV